MRHWEIKKKIEFQVQCYPHARGMFWSSSVVDPPVIKECRIFTFLSRFYACGKCPACRQCKHNLKKRKDFTASATNRKYQKKNLITFDTVRVVHMLECDFGFQYVRRTSRPMGVRIAAHVNNIKRGLKTHISKHFRIFHNRDPRCLKFWSLEKVTKHWRGGDYIRKLSQQESLWIHKTQVVIAAIPRDLNVEFNLNCFISDKQQLISCV